MNTRLPNASLPTRKHLTLPKSFCAALRAVTPAHFAYTVSEGRWIPYEHLLLLNRKLIDVAAGRIKRLMVFMPPRHGKSELVSRYFPAWYIGTFPDKRIILASYEADFAATWGRKARNLLEEFGPSLFGVKVSSDSSAASRWDIEGHEGGMATAGVRGPITGKGASVAIIDDPVKNNQEAMSQTRRETTWEWYRATFSTRIQDDGAIILVMTRWHEDDLAGRLLKAQEEGGDKWEVVRLPALAEEDDILGRQPGEPLCPELFTKETLEQTRARLGLYWWNALYQQRPMPAGGGIFRREWFRYFSEEGEFYLLYRPEGEHRVRKDSCWLFQTIDLAASLKSTADYFVIATWAVTPQKDLLLMDVLRTRVEGPEQRALLRQAYERWRPSFQGIERAGYQLTLVQEAKRQGLPVKELVADRDKVARALPAAARYEAGTVYHRAGAPWLMEYEYELVSFPNGEHDDQVDCAGYAARELASILEPRIRRL